MVGAEVEAEVVLGFVSWCKEGMCPLITLLFCSMRTYVAERRKQIDTPEKNIEKTRMSEEVAVA